MRYEHTHFPLHSTLTHFSCLVLCRLTKMMWLWLRANRRWLWLRAAPPTTLQLLC